MMNKMYKKLGKKGFTLMEMLIVVAIIAILIAIAIPTFTSALNRTRAATDTANNRSLKALIMAEYMTEGKIANTEFTNTTTSITAYLTANGQSLTATVPTADTAGTPYENSTGYVGATVTVATSGDLVVTFLNNNSDQPDAAATGTT